MADFDYRRMLRLDGQQPTMRDRWTAFYRLWRLADKSESKMWFGHVDCFRVLIGGVAPHWIKLMNECGDTYESLRFMPREVRKNRIRSLHAERERHKNMLASRLLKAIFEEAI